MPSTASALNTASTAQSEGEAPPPKRTRLGGGRPRCPARPYRRVSNEVMSARISDYKNKMDVLQSKSTLLRQRLEMHKLEMEMRERDEVVQETQCAE